MITISLASNPQASTQRLQYQSRRMIRFHWTLAVQLRAKRRAHLQYL